MNASTPRCTQRIVVIAASAVLALTLSACDGSSQSAQSGTPAAPASATSPESVAAPAQTTENAQDAPTVAPYSADPGSGTTTPAAEDIQPVETVRDPEEFRVSDTEFAFTAGDTTCVLASDGTTASCTLPQGSEPAGVAFESGAWLGSAPNTVSPAAVLNPGDTLATQHFLVTFDHNSVLRVSSVADPAATVEVANGSASF